MRLPVEHPKPLVATTDPAERVSWGRLPRIEPNRGSRSCRYVATSLCRYIAIPPRSPRKQAAIPPPPGSPWPGNARRRSQTWLRQRVPVLPVQPPPPPPQQSCRPSSPLRIARVDGFSRLLGLGDDLLSTLVRVLQPLSNLILDFQQAAPTLLVRVSPDGSKHIRLLSQFVAPWINSTSSAPRRDAPRQPTPHPRRRRR